MRWGALGAAVCAFGLPQAASARTDLVELRVEGPNSTLDSGTWYSVRDTEIKRAEGSDCDPLGGTLEFEGLSALTTLGSGAEVNPNLSPVRAVSFDFGPQVCQIAELQSFGAFPEANGGFNYWVNYAGGTSSADVAPVEKGDSVLWYYAIYPPFEGRAARGINPVNYGNVLELRKVPPADSDGEFTVTVFVHEYDGTPVRFEGAEIEGVTAFEDLGNGNYSVEAPDGFSTLAAVDPNPATGHVRSNQLEVCVKANLAACPSAHGRTIVGSGQRDILGGTAGWDAISTRGGDDQIRISSGGVDRVNCGAGDDRVLTGTEGEDDKIKNNCETVVAG
jgi:hypothetical protein